MWIALLETLWFLWPFNMPSKIYTNHTSLQWEIDNSFTLSYDDIVGEGFFLS